MTPIFTPGPVDVPPGVLAAQAKPMIPHRTKEFEGFFHRTAEKAQKIFQTQNHVYLLPSSGTGMQEAAVRNLTSEKLLVCVNGEFSQRWYDIAVANGKSVEMLETDWGKPILPDMLASCITRQNFDAIAIVHIESSTGVINPLEELTRVIQLNSPDSMILVDAVSSLAGTALEMDTWGIDFLFTASQLCLALPPGLALASASQRALKKASTTPNRGWYFDLVNIEKHFTVDTTPMTPNIPLVYALDAQIDRILEEGIKNRQKRHSMLARYLQDWASEHNFKLLAESPYQSPTVSVLQNNMNWNVQELNKYLQQRGMTVADGCGPYQGKSIRIAHMGETQLSDLSCLLSALDSYRA